MRIRSIRFDSVTAISITQKKCCLLPLGLVSHNSSYGNVPKEEIHLQIEMRVIQGYPVQVTEFMDDLLIIHFGIVVDTPGVFSTRSNR